MKFVNDSLYLPGWQFRYNGRITSHHAKTWYLARALAAFTLGCSMQDVETINFVEPIT